MYFDKPGKECTKKCVELAIKTAREKNIKHIVVATNNGYTARFFKDVNDLNIVCVTPTYGAKIPGENVITKEERSELESLGFKLLTTTHVLSGAERGISRKFNGISPIEIMAHTLRMFGQGTKVCVEVSIMALDAALIPYNTEVIAVGGTTKGADTAIIITPNHANNILDTKINEIICKPKNF